MSETSAGAFTAYRDAVNELLDAGDTFEEVEEAIEGIAELTEDQRAALWLIAFSKRDRAARHRTPGLFSVN